MKTNILLTIVTLALAIGLAGCTASVSTGNGTNAAANKPANTPAPANTSAPANTAADKDKDKDKSSGASNEELDFTLINSTGYDIKGVSIGPSGDKDWTPEDEVLKGRTFKNGDKLDIKFHPKATAAKWDLKIDWTDGDPSVEWLGVNLTKIEKLTLKYNKESGTTTAVPE